MQKIICMINFIKNDAPDACKILFPLNASIHSHETLSSQIFHCLRHELQNLKLTLQLTVVQKYGASFSLNLSSVD